MIFLSNSQIIYIEIMISKYQSNLKLLFWLTNLISFVTITILIKQMKKIYTILALLITSTLASAQCSDLFFSEYSEGSSNNKYLEVYNPSGASIDLSTYSICVIGNGGSFTNTFQLYGTLGSDKVFVVSTDQSDPTAILTKADTALSFPSITHFNGDDAICLLSGTDTIDVIGVRRVRQNWTVGSGSTKDHTLVRKASVSAGETDWTIAVDQWDVYPQNTWTYLGSHASICSPKTEPSTAAPNPTQNAEDVISIYSESYSDPAGINYFPGWGQSTQYSVFEIGEDSMIKYSALNYQGIDFNSSELDASAMEMLHIDIWTADVDDIDIFPISRATGEKAVKKTLKAGQWNSIDIPLSEYTSQGLSMADIFQFKFDNLGASRGTGTIFIDNMYMWKEPTKVYTVADIVDVIDLDADLQPKNLGSLYEITGVVYGIDYDGNAGLSFTIIDATSGINIFNFVDVSDYVVTEGDEITARGEIAFYNGLLELKVDSIKLNSSGNTLAKPTLVAKPTEDTESEFIQLEKVWIADGTTEWPDNGNVLLTNDAMDTFQIRIDKDIPGIVGEAVAFDTMTIVGIGGQFDGSAPYDEGYQIFPRGLDDIMEWKSKVSVKELNRVAVGVYPNPTSGTVQLLGNNSWNTYRVYNTVGVEVMSGNITGNTITLSGLESGCYFIETANNELVGITRVILNK